MKRISLKLKITLWYTVAMIIVSSIVLVAMNSIAADIIERDITERIVRTVEDTARMSVDFRHNRLRPIPDFHFFTRGVHMVIYDDKGNVVAGQIPFMISQELPLTDETLRNETYNGNHYKVYDKKINLRDGNTYYVKGMVSMDEEMRVGDSTLKVNILVIAIMIMAAAVGGYFILMRALIPVEKINTTAESIIDSGDLSQRINLRKNNDEISSLASTFDRMLQRIEASFENEKQFTSDASHELRTPVAVILSECEYMEVCAKTIDEFKESSASVKRQAEKMSKLISELLLISRMDRNTVNINFENTDISELLSFVCEEQQEIRNDSISLTTDIEPCIFAMADRGLIARLFINLISNAYQYNKPYGTVNVSLRSSEEKVVFSVKDSGIGISPENIDKIWERFYQEDPSRTSDDSGSMGLGLSMVKWIAHSHRGSVDVLSVVGEGSEFIFTFPKNLNA